MFPDSKSEESAASLTEGLLPSLKEQKRAFMGLCQIREVCLAHLSGVWAEHRSCRAQQSHSQTG